MIQPKFLDAQTLLPAVIQDAETKQVLMLAYMNREAYDLTLATGKVTFWSRSRQRIWIKGETSGNFLEMVNAQVDCDGDTLLVTARPTGPVCHTGAQTCFDAPGKFKAPENAGNFSLRQLEQTIHQRIVEPADNSYTNQLIRAGLKKIGQKVGEEGLEVALEAESGKDEDLLNEAADLMYHLLVLLKSRNLGMARVEEVLGKRFNKRQKEG